MMEIKWMEKKHVEKIVCFHAKHLIYYENQEMKESCCITYLLLQKKGE